MYIIFKSNPISLLSPSTFTPRLWQRSGQVGKDCTEEAKQKFSRYGAVPPPDDCEMQLADFINGIYFVVETCLRILLMDYCGGDKLDCVG